MRELVESINDEDYDPENPSPREEQKAEAEFDRAWRDIEVAVRDGTATKTRVPVENAPDNMYLDVRVVKDDSGIVGLVINMEHKSTTYLSPKEEVSSTGETGESKTIRRLN